MLKFQNNIHNAHQPIKICKTWLKARKWEPNFFKKSIKIDKDIIGMMEFPGKDTLFYYAQGLKKNMYKMGEKWKKSTHTNDTSTK